MTSHLLALFAQFADGDDDGAAEVDALLAVWGKRLFKAEGANIIYREDPEALDRLVPLSIYTDMHHFVKLRRLGLVLWEGAL